MSKLFKSLKQVAHGAGLTFLFTAGAYGLTFFFKLLAARYFTQDAFGQFILGETVLNIVVLVIGLGITEGIDRYIPFYKESEEAQKLTGYLRFIFLVPLAGSLLIGAGLYFASPWITEFFDFPAAFSSLLKIVAFAVPFNAFQKVAGQILVAEKRVGIDSFIQPFLEEAIKLAGVGLIIFYNLGITALISLLVISIVIVAIIKGICYYILTPLHTGGDPHYDVKDWFKFSLPLFFSSFLTMFISWTDNFVIGKFLDPADLATYSIAFSIAGTLKVFYKSLSSMFTPVISEYYARDDIDGIKFLFKRVTAWIFGLSLPAFLVMVFYDREILNLLYGNEYAAGGLALLIVACGMMINVSLGPVGAILNIVKETKYIFYADVLTATLNVVGNLALVPFLGITGAALTSSVSLALKNILYFWWARNHVSLQFDWVYYGKFLLAGVPAALASAAVFRTITSRLVGVLGALAVYGSLYLVLLVLLRTFHRQDYRMANTIASSVGLDIDWLTDYMKNR